MVDNREFENPFNTPELVLRKVVESAKDGDRLANILYDEDGNIDGYKAELLARAERIARLAGRVREVAGNDFPEDKLSWLDQLSIRAKERIDKYKEDPAKIELGIASVLDTRDRNVWEPDMLEAFVNDLYPPTEE